MSEKDVFLGTYEKEFETTMRVLRAFPQEKANLQPHPTCKTAKDLAWMFVWGESFVDVVKSGELDFSKMMPEPPATFDEVLSAYEKQHREKGAIIRSLNEEELKKTISFPAGPGKMADMRRMELLWLMLMDSVHHRGQFSIYLRMAGGKVPSIYGPSGDEPWF
jgi:uncharacterized damage-inducible protein DinB